jgi:hypothetical protein
VYDQEEYIGLVHIRRVGRSVETAILTLFQYIRKADLRLHPG